MRELIRSWVSVFYLMLLGPSLFTAATRSRNRISQCSTVFYRSECRRMSAFFASTPTRRKHAESIVSLEATSDVSSTTTENIDSRENCDDDDLYTPWNNPRLAERAKNNRQGFRSRQHINPLAKKFQQPTTLSETWPRDVFEDLSKPVFLDIGCSRGGFLIDMVSQRPKDYNYLGLEIRPIVVHHAKERVKRLNLEGRLDFVGCNANVDLGRLLTLLSASTEGESRGKVEMVSIQFPDPHFKAKHAKRRVVTPELVETLAQFMPLGATVYLQSDIQTVLDEMRLQFREHSQFFKDSLPSVEEYIPENILGVPTEREVSVLNRNLPVYRAAFKRTDVSVPVN